LLARLVGDEEEEEEVGMSNARRVRTRVGPYGSGGGGAFIKDIKDQTQIRGDETELYSLLEHGVVPPALGHGDNSCCSHTGLHRSHGAAAQGRSINVQQHCPPVTVRGRFITALRCN